MINYDDTVKIPLDALRASSAPLTLPAPDTMTQPQHATPAPSQAPITPIPATPLDCYMQHDRIKHEFRADMLSLYCSIVIVAAIFAAAWHYFFH